LAQQRAIVQWLHSQVSVRRRGKADNLFAARWPPGFQEHSGLIAHTCVEATVRYAAELGYEVTMVKDATADYTDEMMRAALDINIPNTGNPALTGNTKACFDIRSE
jgi:hypothetical protein